MRLRHIEVFHAVYRHGSVSAAARALNVSQPSVSKVLRHAEDQLGYGLFSLARGRLVPTDEAHALFREARDVFDRLDTLRQTARNLRTEGGGHLRIGVVPSLGFDIVPEAVTRFRARMPGVTFSVLTQHHRELVEALYERECDLVVVNDLPANSRLDRIELAAAELVLLAPRGRFDAGGGRLPITALDGCEMVSVAASGPLGETVAAAVGAAGVRPLETVSVQTYFVAASFTRLGAGSCIIDAFSARAMADARTEIHQLDPPLRFDVVCAWLEDRPPSASTAGFLAELRAVLAARKGATPDAIASGYGLS